MDESQENPQRFQVVTKFPPLSVNCMYPTESGFKKTTIRNNKLCPVNNKAKGLPELIKIDGRADLIRYLKIKLTSLQHKLEWHINENINLTDSLKAYVQLEIELKEALQKASIKTDAVKLQIINVEKQYKVNQLRLGEDSETVQSIIMLSKKIDDIKMELASLRRLNASLERRILNVNVNLQKEKYELDDMQIAIQSSHATNNNDKMKMEKVLLHLECAELFDLYGKQLFLVDNLKRQIVCLELSKLFNWKEKEFLRILNSKNNHISK